MKQRPASEVAEGLNAYRAVLERYAGTLDLLSPTGLERLDDYFADAVAYADAIALLSPAPRRLLDVGSGAGLPAIPIAVSLPELPVELVERRRKRLAFLSLALAAVDAPRATLRAGDVRSVAGPPVDLITAQAVGTFALVYASTRHRHAEQVHIFSRRGTDWREDLRMADAEIGSAGEVVAEVPLARGGTLVAVRWPGGTACRSSE